MLINTFTSNHTNKHAYIRSRVKDFDSLIVVDFGKWDGRSQKKDNEHCSSPTIDKDRTIDASHTSQHLLLR